MSNCSGILGDLICMDIRHERFLKQRQMNTGNAAIALLVFLAGILLIGFTFAQAYEMFRVAPDVAVGGPEKQVLNIEGTVNNLVGIIKNVLLLVVMAVIGSVVASQGIKLYTRTKSSEKKTKDKVKAEKPSEPVTGE